MTRPTSTTVPSVTSSTEVTTPPPCHALNPDQTADIEFAMPILAQRIGGQTQARWLLSRTKNVTWPDGSLGCPEPGNSYTQALVEGYQIGLRHDDRFFDYRGADGDDPFIMRL